MKRYKEFQKMFSAQWKLTIREKQAWFWGIFYPVILMSIFMLIFGGDSNDEFKTEVAIVDSNPNPTSEMFLAQLNQIPIIEVKTGEAVQQETAENWVKEKEVDAAIVLPESVEANSVELMVNKEDEQGVTTQAASAIMNQLLQQANLAAAGATPTYELEFSSLSSSENNLSYTDFLLTGMIALAISQGGMFGMVGLVDMQRKGLIKRLRMTPANMSIFGLSDMVMRLVFSIIQIVLLSIIGVLIFDANLYINFISLTLVFIIGALSFNALGYFFSSFSNTTESYMGVANIVAFLMMFLSGIFFPIETMPDWLQPVSNVLPLTYFAEGLRDSMVYDTSLMSNTLWMGIGVLVAWGVVAFGLGSWLYKRKSIVALR